MSPWRTLQLRIPARSSRLRASASMSWREVDAEAALDLRPEQLEHAPGAGAEIEQRAERPVAEGGADRGFDRFVGGVQPADAVPLGGVAAEIVLRRRGAAPRAPPASRSRSRAMIGIGRIELFDEPRTSSALGAALAAAEERPRPLAEPLDQAGLGQQLEMAGNPRLRLAQDFGELRHGQFRLGQQREDAQPRLFPGCLERGIHVVERKVGRRSWWE